MEKQPRHKVGVFSLLKVVKTKPGPRTTAWKHWLPRTQPVIVLEVPTKTATHIQHRCHERHSTSLWFLALMSTSSSRPWTNAPITDTPLPSSCCTAVIATMLLFPDELNIKWYWYFYLFVFTAWSSCIAPYMSKVTTFRDNLNFFQDKWGGCQRCWWWGRSLRPKLKKAPSGWTLSKRRWSSWTCVHRYKIYFKEEKGKQKLSKIMNVIINYQWHHLGLTKPVNSNYTTPWRLSTWKHCMIPTRALRQQEQKNRSVWK